MSLRLGIGCDLDCPNGKSFSSPRHYCRVTIWSKCRASSQLAAPRVLKTQRPQIGARASNLPYRTLSLEFGNRCPNHGRRPCASRTPAYSTARNLSQEPDKFGQGSEEGIIASEAANNATVGGALIPLIALGIPGSVIDSILLGALVIHGLQPGPLLFKHNPEVVYIIMATALAASVVMLLVMWFAVGTIAQLTDVPRYLLIPAVLTFCVIGSYALGNRMFDVWVMLGFGLAGYLLQRLDIPLAPFVIGFVLAGGKRCQEPFIDVVRPFGGVPLPCRQCFSCQWLAFGTGETYVSACGNTYLGTRPLSLFRRHPPGLPGSLKPSQALS